MIPFSSIWPFYYLCEYPTCSNSCISNHYIFPMPACSVLSDSFRPSRFLYPWGFSGKNTGVGCHLLSQGTWDVAGSSSWLRSVRQLTAACTHDQMVNTEIRLIIFFAAKDGEALYSQQKQDQELTVAQIMNSLLPNSDSNWRKQGKLLDHSGMT